MPLVLFYIHSHMFPPVLLRKKGTACLCLASSSVFPFNLRLELKEKNKLYAFCFSYFVFIFLVLFLPGLLRKKGTACLRLASSSVFLLVFSSSWLRGKYKLCAFLLPLVFCAYFIPISSLLYFHASTLNVRRKHAFFWLSFIVPFQPSLQLGFDGRRKTGKKEKREGRRKRGRYPQRYKENVITSKVTCILFSYFLFCTYLFLIELYSLPKGKTAYFTFFSLPLSAPCSFPLRLNSEDENVLYDVVLIFSVL